MKNYHKNRCPHHDYRSKCIYLITINKEPGVEPFSLLFGTQESALAMNALAKKIGTADFGELLLHPLYKDLYNNI